MNRKRLWATGLGLAGLIGAGLIVGPLTLASLQPGKTCCADDVVLPQERRSLALMTGLPLYWPLDASFAQITQDAYETPWFRTLVEPSYELVPIDTLSPIPALDPDGAPEDPLKGVARLALVQPRGLSPADNVALDAWVRGGGRLLLALDPALSGDYDLPLGDPRLPGLIALIPPVVERWGLLIRFDEGQSDEIAVAPVPGGAVPVHLYGEISGPVSPAAGPAATDAKGDCTIHVSRALAQCRIGKGRVTLLADAAVFEHRELAGEQGQSIAALLSYAFADGAQ